MIFRLRKDRSAGMLICACLFFTLCGCAAKQKQEESLNGDLLLVIDMQKAYTEEGPWTCPRMDEAADHIIELMESGKFGKIIFTRFDAPEAPVGAWNDYNEINREVNEDEEMSRIIPELEPYLSEYPCYSKDTYSSMSVEEIQKAAAQCMESGGSLVLSGVVSECCVLATAFDAIDLGSHVTYISDACAGVSEESESAAVEILRGLDYVQTAVMDTAQYLDSH